MQPAINLAYAPILVKTVMGRFTKILGGEPYGIAIVVLLELQPRILLMIHNVCVCACIQCVRVRVCVHMCVRGAYAA